MKKLLITTSFLTILFLGLATIANAANRYWVGLSGGMWDSYSTYYWSATSGGTSGASVPTDSDNVFFDANSGTGTIMIYSNIYCKNLNFTGFTGMFGYTGNQDSIFVYGSLTCGAGMTWNYSNQLLFSATSGINTITTNGIQLLCSVTFLGLGGTWQLGSDIIIQNSNGFILDNGTFDANNHNITCGSFSSSNSNTRAITMGSGTWTLTGIGTIWDFTVTTNLTFNANTSTLKITNSAGGKTFNGGGLTYYNLWNANSSTSSTNINGSNTFNDLKSDSASTMTFDSLSTQTVSSLTMTGTSGNLIHLDGYNGNFWTILKSSGTVVLDYCYIAHSIATGGATFYAGSHSVDAQNNTGWIFGDPDTITVNPDTICAGSSTIMGVIGSLDAGANWNWYTGSCGGTYIISGAPVSQSPTITTTYWVRAESSSNTAVCVSATVFVSNISFAASSVTVTPAIVCPGASSILTFTGGTLGTAASWVWYSNSCGGALAGNGLSINISPSIVTSYYVRAEGACNSTTCVSTTITLNINSTAAISASGNSPICSGSSTTLGISGGSLGTGAIWKWYSGSCGGTYITSGAAPVLSPTTTTTYYVSAVGLCNSTSCANVTIIINSSIAATSVTGTTQICQGNSTTLGLNGGSLGTGANWNWYTGSCGGTYVISGSAPILSPTITTKYYVRAQGSCNTTTCVSITITIGNLSSAPTSVTASPSVITTGSSSTLTEAGGVLGLNSQWYWYNGSCGGTSFGTGTSIIVSPSINSVFYVRAEGTCNITNCVSVTVSLCTNSSSASSASASPSLICSGSSSTLSVTGGSLGVGAVWKWYSVSCGGITRGTGINLTVAPTVTTIYYVRAQGVCNTTTCISTRITVNILSTPAASATGISPICPGNSITLGITGGSLGTGAIWNWYTGSCGGTYLTSGVAPVLIPTATIIYYVCAVGTCNTTTCADTTITLEMTSFAATSASGNSPICPGSSTTLGITGGSLGSGAVWNWYTGSCGSTYVTSGAAPILSPTIPTTYYVRAVGTCNYTTCVNTTITLSSTSSAASSASGNSPICPGSSTTLGITGGSLGSGAVWNWYTGSCGGTFVTSGATPILSPTVTTTYYVRAVGTCNSTSCVNTTITLSSTSSAASSASGNSPICPGNSTTLGVTGGSLGSGAVWNWYTSSCGSTYVTSGASPILSPTVTTIYYVRAEGSCNSTTCVNTTITLDTASTAAISASGNTPICPGSSTTFVVTGGSLGTGAVWNWYTGFCGGTFVTSGASPILSPTVTTTYYVRAEGFCNSTTCVNTTISLDTTSTAAISAFGITPICPGSSTTLGISGGSLGTGAVWSWYTGSCGGTFVTSGVAPVLYPTVTTTYFVSAIGTCNSTTCVNTTITLDTASTAAISASGNTPICPGSSTTLGISGGSLGTGAIWNWYSGSCGGTYITSGVAPVLSPTSTTTYYISAVGTCNSTTCVSTTITLDTISTAASSASGNTPICPGSSTTLGISGGNLGTGADWYWYTGSCGGTLIISGISPVLSPIIAETYYLRAEGICNTTTCVSITILVNINSLPADSITATQTLICAGNSITLGISGGSLGTSAEWYWYGSSCGGTIAGSGLSIIVNPLITTDYYSRAEGICNTTTCNTKTLTVNPLPVPIINSNSPVCYGDTLKLFSTGGNLYSWTGPDTITSSLQNPAYPDFISGGEYYVTITTIAGCSATDSINVTLQPMSTLQGILKYSLGNLNSINATIELYKRVDTLFNFYDSVAYTNSYTFNNLQPGDYIIKATIHGTQFPHIMPSYFDSAYKWINADTIIIPCNSNITKDIKMYEIIPLTGGNGLISGNIWYLVPGTKTIGEPVPGAEVILSQEPGDDPISYTQTDTSGFYSFDSIPNGTYSLIVDIPGYKLKSTYPISVTPFNLTFLHRNFLVDTSDTGRGIYREGGTGITPDKFTDFSVVVYPNPYKDKVYISYNLFKTSYVNVEILDMLGSKLETITDVRQIKGSYDYMFDNNKYGLKSGIYFVKFIVDNTVFIKKIVNIK